MPAVYLLAPFALTVLVVATALLVFTQQPSANSPLAARRQSGATPHVVATTLPAPSLTPTAVALTASPILTPTVSPTVVTPTVPPATATPQPTTVPTELEEMEEESASTEQQGGEGKADEGPHLPTTGADPPAQQGEEQPDPHAGDTESETVVSNRPRYGSDGTSADFPLAEKADGDVNGAGSSDDSTTDLEGADEGAISSSPVTPEPTARRPAPPQAPALRIAIVRSPAGFTGTHLRVAPGQGFASLRLLANGTRVQVLGPLAVANGFRWLQVRTLDGLTGWAVAVAL
jgi:hypothetical protein